MGDVLLVGLTDPVPRNAVRLELSCHIDGVGVDPDDPPLIWEAWNGGDWSECEVSRGRDRRPQPRRLDHAARAARPRGRGLRGRAGGLAPGPRRRGRRRPARVQRVTHHPRPHRLHHRRDRSAVLHAEIIEHETIGASEGVPGQRFDVLRRPVLAGAGAAGARGHLRRRLAGVDAGRALRRPAARTTATICSTRSTARSILGPWCARPTAPPPVRRGARQGRDVRMRSLHDRRRTRRQRGQGLDPHAQVVDSVRRRRREPEAGSGGVDGEDLESAKARGPIMLRTRSRAVTAEDFEQITREAAPEIARVRCLAAGTEGVDAGARQGARRAGRGPGTRTDPVRGPRAPGSRPSSGSGTGSTRPG